MMKINLLLALELSELPTSPESGTREWQAGSTTTNLLLCVGAILLDTAPLGSGPGPSELNNS